MTNTTARIKKAGKDFEVIVDQESALKFRKEGVGSSADFLEIDRIFSDSKKGFAASDSDLNEAFGTTDANQIAERIVQEGEILTTQDYRDEEKEKKVKQVVDFLSHNAVDPQSGNPLSTERIKNALEEAHINIKNGPIENQIKGIVEELTKILPIKVQTKRIKTVIPAIHTGRAYGVINQYKEEENWQSDGSLEAVLNIPSGMIMDFYDKLNSATQGSAITEEIKD